MSIDKRGANTWRFRIYKDGKNYTKTFKGTEKQAPKAHDLFKLEIERGEIKNELDEIVEGISSPKTTSSISKIYIPNFIIEIMEEYIDSLLFIPPTKQFF